MDAECVADFVDGSLGITYWDEIIENYAETSEENNEEVVEEIAE
jgi:uncharacterized protein (DUF2164 family)